MTMSMPWRRKLPVKTTRKTVGPNCPSCNYPLSKCRCAGDCGVWKCDDQNGNGGCGEEFDIGGKEKQSGHQVVK